MGFEVTATRKRPQRFESLAGQEFVVSTLKNAVSQGRIAHAYLFSGPRGVGKTTTARLLAKALNCVHGPTAEPCGVCEHCTGISRGNSLDVIEIDGASNTGVNDVRAIKEEVMFPPSSSRYKIYIIDEVHMLSQSAFNALLKTIEEPPEYVVFIFATTETQKVPATIRSRCQQFNFRLIPIETIKGLLSEAANELGIEAEDEALFWIAREATGSMRDAYTLFDQVVSFSDGKITLARIREKLGLVGQDRINDLMLDVLGKRQATASEKLGELLARGVSIEQIIKDLTDYFRALLLIKEGVKSENVLGKQISDFPREVQAAYNIEQLEAVLDMFLDLYRNIRYSLNPRFELELAVSRLGRLRYAASNTAVLEQLARLKNDLINGSITPLDPNLADIPSVKPEYVPERTAVPEAGSRPSEEASMPEPDGEPSKKAYVSEPDGKPSEETSAPEADNRPSSEEASVPETVENEPEPHKDEPKQEGAEERAEEKAQEKPAEPDSVRSPGLPESPQYSVEDLRAAFPPGVGGHEFTKHGLVLNFGSKFFYNSALENLASIRERIQKVTGPDVNVVVSFSGQLEEQRKEAMLAEQEHAAQKTEKEPDYIDDIMYAFGGHEIK